MELQRRGEDNGINDADLSIERFSTFKSDRLVRLHLQLGAIIQITRLLLPDRTQLQLNSC